MFFNFFLLSFAYKGPTYIDYTVTGSRLYILFICFSIIFVILLFRAKLVIKGQL